MIYDFINTEIVAFAKKALWLFKSNTCPLIIDVGCATGKLGRALKESHKMKIYGIEIDKDAANIARRYYDNVYMFDLERVIRNEIEIGHHFGYRKYNLMIFGDVLEHTTNPAKILKEFKKLLAPDGMIIVSLPNVANLKIRLRLLLGNFDYIGGILDPTHLKFYSMKTAQQLIEGAGYKIVASRNNNGRLLSRLLGRIYPKMFALEFVYLCECNPKIIS